MRYPMLAYFLGTNAEYRLAHQLTGSRGAINCLAFTKDAKLLASGGDDEAVRIWDVETGRCRQIIEDQLERWGQVTCMKWLSESGTALCFGAGRGGVLIFQRTKEQKNMVELSNTNVFPFNEPVESLDYDRTKSRIVVAGHSGLIKLYLIEKNGNLSLLWSKELRSTSGSKQIIPRSAQFLDKGEKLVVFGLESGEMFMKAAATGADSASKCLKSGIGNARMCHNGELLIVDNLGKGFDLYQYPRTSPIQAFKIPRAHSYVKDMSFIEGGRSAACSSDHGAVYLYELEEFQCIQKLKAGRNKADIQAPDSSSTEERHLLTAGSSEQDPAIFIWEKRVLNADPAAENQGERSSEAMKMFAAGTLLNICIFLAILVVYHGYAEGRPAQDRHGQAHESMRKHLDRAIEYGELLLGKVNSDQEPWVIELPQAGR